MKKWLIITIVIISFIILVAISSGMFLLYYPNVIKEDEIDIPKNATFEQVLDSIEKHQILKYNVTFRITATLLKYPHYVQRGKYKIENEKNNFELIQKLYRGQHYPVKFTFNNIRTKKAFIDKVNHHFLFPPNDLAELLNDSLFLSNYQLSTENAIAIFIPNTYEIYYDIDAIDFFEKMYSYYNKFWNESRQSRANAIGLFPVEVVILASIVEEENHREKEKAIIAGVYINRLKRGMKLQADPTVKFAIGNFALKRILYPHLAFDSPYNTYLYEGLPPGPIRIPESSTVDSVLNYQQHNYIYMCAKADLSGYHLFTSSLQQHLRNAAQYQKAIKGIEKK